MKSKLRAAEEHQEGGGANKGGEEGSRERAALASGTHKSWLEAGAGTGGKRERKKL